MMWLHKAIMLAVAVFVGFAAQAAHAGTPAADRVALEAGVRAEVMKDLAAPYRPTEGLSERSCLDGRPVRDFQGDLVEYWANLECPYCGVQEPVQAQRNNPGMCIVVRHMPTGEYSESLKKALSYEALKKFSINAANLFWDKVLPKNTLGIPVPYEGSLLWASQEAAISPDAFAEALTNEAARIVNQDIATGQGRIVSTPTYVLEGIRFSACDFTAAELPAALDLAKKARQGEEEALERVIKMITDGLLNEKTS